MSLRGTAHPGEHVSHGTGRGDGSQHADSRFAPFQLAADPLAIRLAQSQILVVKCAQQPTAYQASHKPHRGDQRDDGADTGALAPTALANLVGLELAILV